MRYEFLYRDGANYKKTLVGDVYRELEVGQEITMEELGYRQLYFHEHFIQGDNVGWKYDEELDHNILDVIGVADELQKIDFTAQQPIK